MEEIETATHGFASAASHTLLPTPPRDVSHTVMDTDRRVTADFIKIGAAHRRSVPHSSDGESNADDDTSGDDDDDDADLLRGQNSDDSLHLHTFMPRRHSLPVSSLNPMRSKRFETSSLSSASSPSQFSLRARRRHSLPAPRLPNIGIDIFNELSSQLDTVDECSFNDDGVHYGEKISLQSLNPGALPDAHREAVKLTSAHGLDSTALKEQLIVSIEPVVLSSSFTLADIAQTPPLSSSPHRHQALHRQSARYGGGEATQQQHKDTAAGIKHLMNYNMKNWTALNVNQKKIQRLLGNPQHSVLIGRERRAVSIPTHFRLKSILLALGSSAASRRVSMGDQPIYLDSTPLLNSPVSGILVPANRNDNNLRFSIMCSCNFLIVVAGIE